MNQSPPKTSKEDSYATQSRQYGLHSHNNSHHLRKAVKKTPSSTDQESKEKGSAQGHPSGSADKIPQGPAPTAPTTQTGGDHHRLPQPTIKIVTTRFHQECNGTTNRSNRAPAKWQRPRSYQSEEEGIRTLPWNFVKYRSCYPALLTHQRTLSYVQDVAKVATGAEIVLIIISVIFVE